MDATPQLVFAALSWADLMAILLFIACLLGATILIERSDARAPSVGGLMAGHREAWMATMAERDVRILDGALLGVLHQGAGFFASATMIAIGGAVALIGSAERLSAIADDLAAAQVHRSVWELKLLFLVVLLVLALLSFIWAVRLFGYCAVLIGATPPASEDVGRRRLAARVAAQAAALNIRAARNFNRGLRLIYFSLAALAWLLGPLAFALATLLTTAMLYRREFASETRRILAESSAVEPPPEAAAEKAREDAPGR